MDPVEDFFMRWSVRHIYWALRYGEWSAGWEMYKGKPMIGVYLCYYDGHHCCLHAGPGWLAVHF